MNKTIKEQAQEYYKDLAFRKSISMVKFAEHIITEERKRRLPTKEEVMNKYKEFWDRDESGRVEDVADLYDWLLSYESEAVVEDEVKGEECRHQYSRAIQQLYPRLCLKCGKPESVKVEDITQPNDVNGTTFNEIGRMTYQPINRNELAEKIMIAFCKGGLNPMFSFEATAEMSFSLANEFIKQAKS